MFVGSWFWRSGLLFVPPSELISIAFEVSPPTVITAELTKWSSAESAPSWFGCNATFVTASEIKKKTQLPHVCNSIDNLLLRKVSRFKISLHSLSTPRCDAIPYRRHFHEFYCEDLKVYGTAVIA